MKDNRHYVYQIIDPRNQKVLYIGKGNGGRCYFHFTITRKKHDKEDDGLFNIIDEILDTTNYTQFDCVQILHSGLSDEQARKLELDLIKFVGYENLYNRSSKAEWMNGSKWMNNGVIDKQFLKNQEIPEEFCYPGRITKHEWLGKNKGKTWITNGKNDRMINNIDEIPDGWRAGRTYSVPNKVAWNKGLTKYTDDRIQKFSNTLLNLNKKQKHG